MHAYQRYRRALSWRVLAAGPVIVGLLAIAVYALREAADSSAVPVFRESVIAVADSGHVTTAPSAHADDDHADDDD